MKSLDILYQIYRARYSLEQVQSTLDAGYKLAIISSPAGLELMRSVWGQRHSPFQEQMESVALTKHREWMSRAEQPAPDTKQEDSGSKLLDSKRKGQVEYHLLENFHEVCTKIQDYDAAVIYLDDINPKVEQVREWARAIPLKVDCIWLSDQPSSKISPDFGADSATPRLNSIDPLNPAKPIVRLMEKRMPSLTMGVAHDFSTFRFHYSKMITRKAARKASVLAAASTIPAPPVPGLNIVWSFFATTGETLAITAAQLRLCLMMAAIHGRPIDFFDRIGELWPIIGSAFGWRTLAREVTGLVPIAGWFMKSSLAYTGTFMVGEAARIYYEHGQPASSETIREIKRRARMTAEKALKRFEEAAELED